MKTRLLIAMLMACLVMRVAAGRAMAFAADGGNGTAANGGNSGSKTPAEPVRPTTVGGGVKKPWTPPYMLALVTAPEPTAFGMMTVALGILVLNRMVRRRELARAGR